jgi:hypothetical protein
VRGEEEVKLDDADGLEEYVSSREVGNRGRAKSRGGGTGDRGIHLRRLRSLGQDRQRCRRMINFYPGNIVYTFTI